MPYLKFDEKPYTTSEKYISDCAMWLNDGDLESLKGLSLNEPFSKSSKLTIQKKWREFEINLRNELLYLRLKDKDENISKFKRHSKELAGSACNLKIKAAFSDSSPYGAERKLMQARWEFLDSLEEDDYFGFTNVAVYYLKLKLLERFLSLNKQNDRSNQSSKRSMPCLKLYHHHFLP